MKTSGQRRSTNYEDRRGQRPAGGGGRGFGGGSFLPFLLMRLFRSRGGRIVLLLIVLFIVFSGVLSPGAQEPSTRVNNPPAVEDRVDTGGKTAGPADEAAIGEGRYAHASDEELKDFLLVVLASTEDVWEELFREAGATYQPTTLVFFTDYVQSACGMSTSATGPFYCPGDGKTYMDLGFFRELSERFGADGDFAIAYVLAHEVGHHVQNQLGVTDQVAKLRRTASKYEVNRMTVRVELQADYFAGVWAHYADDLGLLEEGDIEEAIRAALAIGDDRLQKEATGRVSPENFTHGTSEQRARWFRRGFEYGDFDHGDTFSLDYDSLRR